METSHRNNVVKRLKNGCREAFEEVYFAYQGEIFGLALRYLKDEQLAEDAVQDVFVKLWTYASKLDEEKSLRGFLASTLKHHVLNMIREKERRILRHYEYSSLYRNESQQTEHSVILSDYERIYHQAIRQLPAKKQLVYQMKIEDGLTDQQVADRLGISRNTVKSQFFRARNMIREFLTHHADM